MLITGGAIGQLSQKVEQDFRSILGRTGTQETLAHRGRFTARRHGADAGADTAGGEVANAGEENNVMGIVTRESAIAILRGLQPHWDGDVEAIHQQADDVLCELLKALGYEDVVEEWRKVPKWYS